MRAIDGVDFNGQKGINVAAPTAADDLSTKSYTDTGDAGRLRCTGTWNGANGYAANDVVFYAGRAYLCTNTIVAAASSSMVGSSSFTTDTGASNQNMALPSGSAVGDVLVWMCDVMTPSTQVVTINLPGTLVTTASTTNSSSNKVSGQLNTYTLVAADVINGYVTLPSQAANTPLKITSVFYSFRNVFTTTNFTKSATSTTVSQTPAGTSYIVSMAAYTLGGGNFAISQAALTATLVQVNAVVPNSVATNQGSVIGYETVTGGVASTARAFSNAGSTNAHAIAYQLVQNTGTNPAPDSAGGATNWTLLAPAQLTPGNGVLKADFIASSNQGYAVDTSSVATQLNVTMPAAPSVGDEVLIQRADSSANILNVVAASGQGFRTTTGGGGAGFLTVQNVRIQIAGTTVRYIFDGTNWYQDVGTSEGAVTGKTLLAITAGVPGWRNFAGQAPLAYSKSRDGLVTLEGYVQPGTAATVANTTYTIATLPAGARPLDGTEFFPSMAYPNAAAAIVCRMQVDTTGLVRIYTPVIVPLSAGVTMTGSFIAQQ